MKKPKPKKSAKKSPSFCSRCAGRDPHCYICGKPKAKQQPAERDHAFNPEDVARLNND